MSEKVSERVSECVSIFTAPVLPASHAAAAVFLVFLSASAAAVANLILALSKLIFIFQNIFVYFFVVLFLLSVCHFCVFKNKVKTCNVKIDKIEAFNNVLEIANDRHLCRLLFKSKQ